MQHPTRRHVSINLIQAAACYHLYRLAFGASAFAKAIEPITDRWLTGLVGSARAVQTSAISVTAWQDQVEALHHLVPIRELLSYIDFDRVIAQTHYPKNVAAVKRARFPKIAGLPPELGFHGNIFAYRKGAATPPHVHNNLVSAHLVLRGTLHARTYHRLADEADAVILRPSIDKEVGAGDTISMSDDRDNAHWFVATSAHAYTLDIPIPKVNLGKHYALTANEYGQLFVDPTTAPSADGSIRAPLLAFEDALKKFGGV